MSEQVIERKAISPMLLRVMNSGLYLFTIEETARLFRVNRDKFIELYINTKKIPLVITEDNKKMIRHSDIQKYQEEQLRIIDPSTN